MYLAPGRHYSTFLFNMIVHDVHGAILHGRKVYRNSTPLLNFSLDGEKSSKSGLKVFLLRNFQSTFVKLVTCTEKSLPHDAFFSTFVPSKIARAMPVVVVPPR